MSPRLSRKDAWLLALAASSTMAVSYFDRQTLAVLAPTVQAELHISDTEYGWLVSAFSMAYLVGTPIAGVLIDRVGARRGLLGAVLLWSLVAALHAVAPGFGVLFALRIALGVAESPSFPGAAQTIHRALPPAERSRGLGVAFSGSSFGAMLAPPLATFLEHRFGFRVAFLGTALIGLLWVPIWLRVAYRPAAREVLDRTAAPAEESGGERVRARSLLFHPVVLRYVAIVLATSPLLSFAFNWSPKLLVSAFGVAQHEVMRYLWFPPLFFDAGAIGFGHLESLSRAKGALGTRRSLFAIALGLTAAGVLVPFAGGPLPAMLLVSVSLVGGGGLFTLGAADAAVRVPGGSVSTAMGIGAAAQSLAYIVANPLIGMSVTATRGYTQAILLLTAWVLPGAIAWLVWPVPSPQRPIATS